MVFILIWTLSSCTRFYTNRAALQNFFDEVLGNPHSFFWPIEALGYGFMGLSTLFAGLTFFGGFLEKWIRALFIVNGFLGIAGVVAYPLEVTTIAVLSALALWTLIFPLSTILLAISFRRRLEGTINEKYPSSI